MSVHVFACFTYVRFRMLSASQNVGKNAMNRFRRLKSNGITSVLCSTLPLILFRSKLKNGHFACAIGRMQFANITILHNLALPPSNFFSTHLMESYTSLENVFQRCVAIYHTTIHDPNGDLL